MCMFIIQVQGLYSTHVHIGDLVGFRYLVSLGWVKNIYSRILWRVERNFVIVWVVSMLNA